TSTDLKDSFVKSVRFKELAAKIGVGTLMFANQSDKDRYYCKAPWFLVAFESQLTLQTIGEKLHEYRAFGPAAINREVDAVFILDRGYVLNVGDGKGAFQICTEAGNP